MNKKHLLFATMLLASPLLAQNTKKEEKKEDKKPEMKAEWQTHGNYADSLHFLGTVNKTPLIFKTNNIETMRLNTFGFLGIGIINPSTMLDVGGSIRSTALKGTGINLLSSDANGVLSRFAYANDSNQVLYGNGNWGNLPKPIWATNGDNIYSLPTGNVGVGVLNPSEKLEVAGTIKADSIILTKGLYVPPSQVVNITNLQTTNVVSNTITTSRILPDTSGLIAFGTNTILMGAMQQAGSTSNVLFTSNTGINNYERALWIQSNPLNNNNTIINAYNTGNVGIGIANPQQKLELLGNILMRNTKSAVIYLHADGLDANQKQIFSDVRLMAHTGNGLTEGQLQYNGRFSFAEPIGGTTRMVLYENGNVGIGLDVPKYKLHVAGNVNATQYLQNGVPITGSQWLNGTGNINYMAGSVGIGTATPKAFVEIFKDEHEQNLNFALSTPFPNYFQVTKKLLLGGTSTLFVVKDTGNVGIGTATPQNKLEVAGGVIIGQHYVNDPTRESYGMGYGNLLVEGDIVAGTRVVDLPIQSKLHINQTLSTAWTGMFVNTSENGKGIRIQGGSVDGTNPLLQIDDNNGTTNFLVTAAGKAYAREVTVKTGPFPDYVFESNYPLMPLKELHLFLKTNKHLPNVPSAKEIEANKGVNLGELQLKNLEKTEELYLYLLQLNSKIEELEKQNTLLKQQMDGLGR